VIGTQTGGVTFDAAVLSHGLLNSAPSGGSSVTVMGLSFGSYNFTATGKM
jgi:hypothetical protein